MIGKEWPLCLLLGSPRCTLRRHVYLRVFQDGFLLIVPASRNSVLFMQLRLLARLADSLVDSQTLRNSDNCVEGLASRRGRSCLFPCEGASRNQAECYAAALLPVCFGFKSGTSTTRKGVAAYTFRRGMQEALGLPRMICQNRAFAGRIHRYARPCVTSFL